MDLHVEHGFPGRADTAAGTSSAAKLISVLRGKAWLIVACATAGLVAAYVVASTMPKYYTSSAELALEGGSFAIPELQGALRDANSPDPMPTVRTEMQALSSREMVQKVVDQLDLVHNPEFNATLRPPTLFGRINAAVHSLLPKGDDAPKVSDPNEGVLVAAGAALHLFQDNRSLVIDVSFTSRDSALAADFVNTLIADYLDARSRWRNTANEGASEDMTQRIAQVRSDLDAIEQKMRDLRSRSGAVGLRAGSVGQQQLEELATAADHAALERAQAQASYDRATAAARQGDSAALASVLGSETISRLRGQESDTSRRIADLGAGHGDNYPGLRGARSDLAAIRAQEAAETQRIVASLGAQLQVTQAHEADIREQLSKARTAAVSGQNIEAELTQLQADAASQRQVYQTLLERAQQTGPSIGKAGAGMPDVRLLSRAVPSGFPSSPKMKIAGALGLVGGGVLGCLLAFVRVRGEDGFSDADTLAEVGGLTVAATIPASATGRRGRLLSRVASVPGGPEAETMRAMRARLRSVGRPVRSVAFASIGFPAGGEHAMAAAAAFARVVAADGERVLLVEGDVGRPRLSAALGLRGGALEAVLAGDGDWRDAMEPDAEAPMDVLAAGKGSDDGAALAGGVAFQNLLMEARDDYGIVVVSASAADEAVARTFAQRCDATILIVDGRRASREDVRTQAERLRMLSRVPLLAVLVARG